RKSMTDTNICEKIEKGLTELLNRGESKAKAGEIAESGNIEKNDVEDPARTVGRLLSYNACDFDDFGYEVLRNDDDSNDYRFWRK
ncbi:MAG: hypothetical protein ABEI86_04495, partial [Halobacteriaceae archaeon]